MKKNVFQLDKRLKEEKSHLAEKWALYPKYKELVYQGLRRSFRSFRIQFKLR